MYPKLQLISIPIYIGMSLVTGCIDIPQQGFNEGRSNKKYFKNINASLFVPENIQEVEAPNSYTFVGLNEESVYVASIYHNQNSEQVKQTLVSSLIQNGYKLSLCSGFSMNSFGLNAADAKMQYGGMIYPGYVIVKEMLDNTTYVLLGCVAHEGTKEQMKSNLNRMALSLQIEKTGGMGNNDSHTGNGIGTVQKSVAKYQDFLMDKVLVCSKHSNDIISTEDWQQSHGRWIASEDVDKTRRFLLCSGGFGYFRFITTGHQITGDYGTFELDKFSGYWRIMEDSGKIGIYMEDERDGRRRFWEINDIKDNFILIENHAYQIFTQEEGGNECGREGGIVVPQ